MPEEGSQAPNQKLGNDTLCLLLMMTWETLNIIDLGKFEFDGLGKL